MSDENKTIEPETVETPEIVIEPEVAEDAAMVPELILELPKTEPDPIPVDDTAQIVAPEAPKVDLTEITKMGFSDEEIAAIENFASQIDLTNQGIVMQYGASAQKKLVDFSDGALTTVRTKDLGEVGTMISGLVGELKGFSAEPEKKGILGFFQKGKSNIEHLKAQYEQVETNVDGIVGALEEHQNTLTKDILTLDRLYELNHTYMKELGMYIIAGVKALETARATTLAELQQKAQETGKIEDAQAANDFGEQCDRFEKKLHDLELTRTISIQMGPQIRLIQNGDTLMVDKIQSTIMNTIPLWKNQMVLALGIEHSRQAMAAQREVTDLTNQLLKKNADTLKQGSIDIATETERGVVDIETLQYTNQQLIETLDEVIRIQDEGKAKRAAAEEQMAQIETEIKNRLLDLSK